MANADKVLSLYEPDPHVIGRGKVGAGVEFGNSLLQAGQPDGLIVNWKFVQELAHVDRKFLKENLATSG